MAAKDLALFENIEKSMGVYRNAVAAGDVVFVKETEISYQRSFKEQEVLDSSNDPQSNFLGAMAILLRDGGSPERAQDG